MLNGEKVILRPLRRADLEYFLKWFNDTDILQYVSNYLPMTEMEGEKYLADLSARANSNVQLVIEAVEDNARKVIGSIGLDNIGNKDHNAHFWIVIGDKDYWSKGCGTEAARLIIRYGFEQLNLHRISSYVYSFNERSLRLHSNVGFTEEGRQREASYKNGKYYDNVNFGILKEEWLKLKNR